MGLYAQHLYADAYPYVTPEELLGSCAAAKSMSDTDDALLDAIDDASLALYYLTGKQFHGTAKATLRPCGADCACGHCQPHAVNLRLWPIIDLCSIRYEGVTYDTPEEIAAIWHVDEYRYLVRNDGEPVITRQNHHAIVGSSQDDEHSDGGWVFEVSFTHGLPTPKLLKRATRALACELLTAAAGGPCRLPERVTGVSRQGISMEVASADDFLRDGLTGLYQVDLAIKTFNPAKLQSPTFVWSADLNYARQVNT